MHNAAMSIPPGKEAPEVRNDRDDDQMARIKGRFARQLRKLAHRKNNSFNAEVNTAVRQYLESEGLWPDCEIT